MKDLAVGLWKLSREVVGVDGGVRSLRRVERLMVAMRGTGKQVARVEMGVIQVVSTRRLCNWFHRCVERVGISPYVYLYFR